MEMKLFNLLSRMALTVLFSMFCFVSTYSKTLYGKIVYEYGGIDGNHWKMYIRYDDNFDSSNSAIFSLESDPLEIYNVYQSHDECKVNTVIIESSVKDYKVRTMSHWFYRFSNLKKIIGLQYLDTSKLMTAESTFEDCTRLDTLDLSKINMPQKSAKRMFRGCKLLKMVDLSGWKVASWNVDMTQMFEDCDRLKTIICENEWKQGDGKYGNSTFMFNNCTSLKGVMSYNSDKTGMEYANPETGYFSYPEEIKEIYIKDYTWPYDFEPGDYEVTAMPKRIVKSATVSFVLFNRSLDPYEGSTGDNIGIRFQVELEDGYKFASGAKAYIERNGEVLSQDSTINMDADNKKCFEWRYKVPGPYDNGVYIRKAKVSGLARYTPVIGRRLKFPASAAGAKGMFMPNADAKEQFSKSFDCGIESILWFESDAPLKEAYSGTTIRENNYRSASKDKYYVAKIYLETPANFYPHKKTVFEVDGKQIATYDSHEEAEQNMDYSVAGNCCAVVTDGFQGIPYAYLLYSYGKACELGDVNHDGNITMADANAVVNYYLAADKPSNFNEEAANVNGDGGVTMADANQIVNIFLSGGQ